MILSRLRDDAMDETPHPPSDPANAHQAEASAGEPERRQQPAQVQQGLLNIGYNIFQARETLEYPLEELARRARISPAALKRLESGAPDADVGDLVAVMYVLWRLDALERATDIHDVESTAPATRRTPEPSPPWRSLCRRVRGRLRAGPSEPGLERLHNLECRRNTARKAFK